MPNQMLNELQSHLGQASKSLRNAWKLCKHNGMQPTAKELADTVLDVETAREQIAVFVREAAVKSARDPMGADGLGDASSAGVNNLAESRSSILPNAIDAAYVEAVWQALPIDECSNLTRRMLRAALTQAAARTLGEPSVETPPSAVSLEAVRDSLITSVD